MDVSEAQDYARLHHRAVLATRTSRGVQQSPVLVGVDDGGSFVVSSRETAFKTKNLRRDPWAQLCVFPDSFFGEWIYIEGEAEVISLPGAMEPLVDYFRQVSGEHSDWAEYRESMRRDRRVLIRIEGRRAGPDRKG